MDELDFAGLGTEGSRRMRIVAAVIGAFVGGGLGVLWALISAATTLTTVIFALIGALAGGVIGAVFAGFVLVGAIIAVAAAIWFFVKDVRWQ